MKSFAIPFALAAALLVMTPDVARAEEEGPGPGTTFLQCRSDAATNYFRCIDAGKNSGWACYWAASIDFAACDIALIAPLI